MAMAVMAILGTILARMLVQDSRFVSKLEAMMDARQSARAAMNAMASELRQASQGAVIAASPDSVTVRAPYAWGIACQEILGTHKIVSLVPTDSLAYVNSNAAGIAWLDDSGDYNLIPGTVVSPSSAFPECTAEGITVFPDGDLVSVAISPDPTVIPIGAVVYLYHEVTYRFGNSIIPELAGRRALWRRATGVAAEEILSPFDSLTRFRFFTEPTDTSLVNPPGLLSSITGLELFLIGESEATPEGELGPQDFGLRTRITFLNGNN